MAKDQLFIPDRINVGFQNRDDTYTKKLAYVIYFDKAGVLRKEKSWDGWRDKKIDTVIHANEPTEGFVLNKGVGGARQSYGWNARNEYIRVYDPRDFEFEISVANLLFILRECDCSRGKGLEGKFVYGWDKNNLVLVPINSTDYQTSLAFTELAGKKINPKKLVPGGSYTTKDIRSLIYLGQLDYFNWRAFYNYDKTTSKKTHIFWDGSKFISSDKASDIARIDSETVHPEYGNLVEKYIQSINGSKIKRLFLEEQEEMPVQESDWYRTYYNRSDMWFFQGSNGKFIQCYTQYNQKDNEDKTNIDYVLQGTHFWLDANGIMHGDGTHQYAYPAGKEPTYPMWGHKRDYAKWVEPTNMRLFAELESGSKFRVGQGGALQEENYNG